MIYILVLGSSRRQSKRLKKKSFPTTSSSAPSNIEDDGHQDVTEMMRNPTFSDDEDFETPVPKTKSKPHTTNLRTEDEEPFLPVCNISSTS